MFVHFYTIIYLYHISKDFLKNKLDIRKDVLYEILCTITSSNDQSSSTFSDGQILDNIRLPEFDNFSIQKCFQEKYENKTCYHPLNNSKRKIALIR